MKKKVKLADLLQLGRFAVVGVSNSIIDFGILNLLLWLYPTTNTWKTLSYNSLAVLLASTNSFIWNKYWTFEQRNRIELREVYRFAVLATCTTMMNDGLMLLLGKLFPAIMQSSLLGANALKLAAIIGTMSISFFGMRLWVFFQKRRAATGVSSSSSAALAAVTADMMAKTDSAALAAVTADMVAEVAIVAATESAKPTVTTAVKPDDDDDTLKMPVIKLVYDVNLMINGVIKPIHEIDTLALPVITVEKQEALAD